MKPPMFGKRKASRSGFLLLKAASLPTLALATLSLTVTESARADEPEPIAVYHPDRIPPTDARTKLYIAGGTLFALSYGAALGSSYLWEIDSGARDLRIPVVGPWLKVGNTALCVSETDGCSNALQVVGAVGAGFDGVFQIAALALLVDAMLVPAATGVPASTTARAPLTIGSAERDRFSFHAIPVFGSGGLGVSVFGAF